MLGKVLIVAGTLLFAFLVLFISVLRSASVRYTFSPVSANISEERLIQENQGLESMKIDYQLAYPGPVLPDHPLWFLKAARDRIWLVIMTNPSRKAELNLLFADKRLGAAKRLFENKKFELGYTTLTKAEKYLEAACNLEEEVRERGGETSELLERLVKASLKHRQVMEQIKIIVPEDVKPKIVEIENYPTRVYEEKSTALNAKGMSVPENPFDGL